MMKCLEKIIKSILWEQVKPFMDTHQFAYTTGRGVEDATLSLIDFVLKHLDNANKVNSKYFVKILFVDFSSAFNTIQSHLIMKQLITMDVNCYIILWINEFLTGRYQYVRYQGGTSDLIITNTGAPQGCVLSPVLFSIYTSQCKCYDSSTQLFKYADDTALVSQCINNDVVFRHEVEQFVTWCKDNHLELNIKKTKEMIVDFRKGPVQHDTLYIDNEAVDVVNEYKYLGTIIDDQFKFNSNVDMLYRKARSRMYFVRQLRKLNIDTKILEIFYTSIVQSVITFSITSWFGSCSVASKNKLSRIVNNSCKLGVPNVLSLSDIHFKCTIRLCNKIYKDFTHPLNTKYKFLPSGKRLQSIKCRTSRYSKTFVPSSIRLLNDEKIILSM